MASKIGVAGVVVTTLSLCAGSSAQEGVVRFSGAADLVVLHLTVTDNKGRYVEQLGREAFAVFEDDRPQRVSFFTAEEVPVTVGLLVDNSTSMQSLRELVIAGAIGFARASHPGDEIFALAFNEDVRPALPAGAPFTNDADVLRSALTSAITARGRTGLFDAIAEGLDYAARGTHQRKVLVLISDGGDNASTSTFQQILTRTQASNVTIYGVAIVDELERDANPGVLKRLAQASGGEAFTPRQARDVGKALGRVAADIRRAYTIGYVPAAPTDGTFRRLRVTAQSPAKQKLVVRTRAGYLAGARSAKERER